MNQTIEQLIAIRSIVRRCIHNLPALLLTALLSLLFAVPTAQAATITADGTTCTLVDAITAANSDTAVGGCAAGSGADTITLNNSVYGLTAVNNDANGLPVITSSITVVGNGATLQRLSAAPAFRFFEVASNGNLSLTGLTLTGGLVGGFGQGGAILNFGTLTVTDSVIQGNRAFTRGGIYNNNGTATLTRVTVSANTSDNGGGAVSTVGGNLLINASTIAGNQSPGGAAGVGNSGGSLIIVNSTISGNTGVGIESSALSGAPPTPATLLLSHATVTGNSVDGVASSLAPTTITLGSSLISGNGANEINAVSGTVINADNDSVIGFGGSARSTNFTPGATDVIPTVPVNAILNPTLQNNGGSTPTHALVTGSPAIDRAATGPATDQRGVSRPQGAAFDAGAFEARTATITADGVTCTLVDAITAANSDAAVGGCAAGRDIDTITLNNGVYGLTAVNNDANGLPVITSPIIMMGNGATLQRLGTAPAFRFFEVAGNGHFTLRELTLTGGQVSGFSQGGAILNFGILNVTDSVFQGNRAFTRGAIYNNNGTTTLTRVLVRNNTSDNGGGAVGIVGGAMTISASTIAGNQSSGGAAGIGNSGGSLTIVNSTISGNTGVGIESSALSGAPPTPATLTLSNATVTGNSVDGVATALAPTTITLARSLIAGNGANEINAATGTVINANTDNVIGFGGSARSTNFTPGATDVVPTALLNAILDPTLQDNGGSTPTHALVTGSPAIDRAASGPATDQRGVSRPQGPAFDAGAFEAESVDNTGPVITPNVSGTLGNNDWYTSDVTVSWSVVDDESAITGQSGCENQSITADTASVTFTCTATSAGGGSSESVTIQRDATTPTISTEATTSPNGNGWYNSNVTVTFTCADALSGVASCPADETLSSEGSAVSSTAQTATDEAGNTSASSNIVTVQIDKTVPVVAVTGVSNGASYTLGSVPTAACSSTDALSGVATQATVAVTGGNPDGTGSFTATCSGATDNAGNSAAGVSVSYSVQAGGVLVGVCGGYTVRQVGNSYTAPGWIGAIKVGTGGNNTLTGGNGPDLILGLGGNDLLRGNGGDDVICGGNGVDLLQGLAGNDYLDGGPGNDVLNGGSGDYDDLLAGDGNDTLLDGDGVRNASGGPGSDLFTLALRNGWRDETGQPRFSGLTAGYGNDVVGLAILNSARFFVDISGDERDTPASPQEGNNDSLALVGVIDPASTFPKFEHQLVLSATDDVDIPSEEAGAEYLTEPVGEEGVGELNHQLFLPLINH